VATPTAAPDTPDHATGDRPSHPSPAATTVERGNS
jgi:hypothetical protein